MLFFDDYDDDFEPVTNSSPLIYPPYTKPRRRGVAARLVSALIAPQPGYRPAVFLPPEMRLAPGRLKPMRLAPEVTHAPEPGLFAWFVDLLLN